MQRDLTTGNNFIKAREEIAGLTQDEVEAKTGIHRTIISRFENGDFQRLNRDKLLKLRELYGVSSDYLLGCTDYPFRAEDGDLYTQTGITVEALQNLKEINESICKPASAKNGDYILSDILSSPSFRRLIQVLVDVRKLAIQLEKDVEIGRELSSSGMRGQEINSVKELVVAVEYGRYAVLDPCNALLNDMLETPVENIVNTGRDYLNEK